MPKSINGICSSLVNSTKNDYIGGKLPPPIGQASDAEGIGEALVQYGIGKAIERAQSTGTNENLHFMPRTYNTMFPNIPTRTGLAIPLAKAMAQAAG